MNERTPEQVVKDFLGAFGRHDVEGIGRACAEGRGTRVTSSETTMTVATALS
jgi:hypothetical protein